jgi:hypothetical protein
MGNNSAFNENLGTWELIDTDGCDGIFLLSRYLTDIHTILFSL